jgi:hypothetical protein
VDGHLIAVEVGVVSRADERMDANGLAFDRSGSKAWIERRCSVGARFSKTGWPLVTSSRMSQTSGVCFSIIFFALRTVWT